jgi:uncharacterized membrane protein YphA (DoxX/SURF4 family)
MNRDRSNQLHGAIFIRIGVGLIFFTQGILKYTDAPIGVERFTRIGFPAFTAYFVRAFEMTCGPFAGLLLAAILWMKIRILINFGGDL